MERVSLVDYPGLTCCTLFTAGCNFRCPWCYNQDLIYPHQYEKLPDLEVKDIQDYLIARRGKIQAVCVTGGEPSLSWKGLKKFFRWCQQHAFKTKLDTNGYLPEVLEEAIDSGLVDFIAMDIKNSWSKYGKTVDLPDIDIRRIKRSIELIRQSGLEHQFRCTRVPKWVDDNEISALELEIGEPIIRQEYLFI